MKNNVIYLKTDEVSGIFVAYDKNNLTTCRVEKGIISFEKFPKMKDLNWSLGYDLQNDYEICTREEFTAFYMGESKFLNEITKEL